MRILLQTFQTNRFQVARDFRIELSYLHRLLVQNLKQRVKWIRSLKRRSPGQQTIEHGTERIDI